MYNDPLLNSYLLRRQRRRRRRLVKLMLLVFFIFGLAAFLSQFLKNIPLNQNQNVLFPKAQQPTLGETVNNALAGAKGAYGIAIKNLKTGESYYLNEHKTFEAGSLYKLWIMAVIYQQIQDGTLTEDLKLSGEVAALNKKYNIASGEAELTAGTVNFTVKSALTQMITISHNYAALILTEKVKLPLMAKFLQDNGFNKSSVDADGDAPVSTASDIALFYEKLYRGELANEQYTNEMIELLKGQKLNDGLPKFLPENIKLAHKTGDIGPFKHDAGIIFTEKGVYIIVVLSESDYPPGAQERIALLSKAVFDHFAAD